MQDKIVLFKDRNYPWFFFVAIFGMQISFALTWKHINQMQNPTWEIKEFLLKLVKKVHNRKTLKNAHIPSSFNRVQNECRYEVSQKVNMEFNTISFNLKKLKDTENWRKKLRNIFSGRYYILL